MRSMGCVCGMLGSPSFYGRDEHQRHDPYQLGRLEQAGIDTVFLNIAWSRPWLDSVNLEDVARSVSYPLLSSTDMAERREEFLRRLGAVKAHGLKAMGLFGIPKYLDFSQLPSEYQVLMGSTQSTISADQNTCVSSPETLRLYTELAGDLLTHAPDLDGMLVYTFDELAEVCAEESDCALCRGIPLVARIPAFLNTLYEGLQRLKPGFELWWEPWELAEAQVYAICEALHPSITLCVHSTINEVYFVNKPDRFVRNVARLCERQGRMLVVECFLSGSGEDLGPIAAYPCPGLVLDQLLGVAQLGSGVGVKEYYGLCVEYFGVNEAALAEFLAGGDKVSILDRLSSERAADPRSAEGLREMWGHACDALMYVPWELSWVMRFSNYPPYGDDWGKTNFKSAMCTPWTTPSWLSSRRSFYHLVENSSLYNQTLYEDTRSRLELAIASASKAIEVALSVTVEEAFLGEQRRQMEALELFTICATARLNWQRLSFCADRVRGSEGALGPDAEVQESEMDELLDSETANLERLMAHIGSAEAKSFLLPHPATLSRCLEAIRRLRDAPNRLSTLGDHWVTGR